MFEDRYTVVVIGSGMAGMTCALYLHLAGVNVMLVGDYMESSLAYAPVVNNYPGFCNSDGVSILSSISLQLDTLRVPRLEERCVAVSLQDGLYRVCHQTDVILAEKLVVATGRRPRLLGLEGEAELIGKGVSLCAVCDGSLYKNKRVAVIGGGNTAVADSIYLSRVNATVELLVRKPTLRATERLDELASRQNISVRYEFTPVGIVKTPEGKIAVTGADGTRLEYDGVFYAVGSIPNIDMLRGLEHLEIGESGEIERTPGQSFYLCGDVSAHRRHQAVIAAASGAETALEIIGDLAKSTRRASSASL